MTYWIVSAILVMVWVFLLIKQQQEHRRFLGFGGACIVMLVLTAFWQAEAVPWLWRFFKAVLLLWQTALIMLVFDAFITWRANLSQRVPLTICSLLSIAVNLAAGLHFLWLATVMPGGI